MLSADEVKARVKALEEKGYRIAGEGTVRVTLPIQPVRMSIEVVLSADHCDEPVQPRPGQGMWLSETSTPTASPSPKRRP